MKGLFDGIVARRGLWRVLVVVFTILAALAFCLMALCQAYSSVINEALNITTTVSVGGSDDEETYYYQSSYSSLEDMYQDKIQLLREIGQEGTVVLKNENGALPITDGNIVVLNEDDGFIYETTTAGGTIKIDHSLCTSLSDGLQLVDPSRTVSSSIGGVSSSDTVIVVIGRAAGEAIDMSKEELELTSDECTLIDSAIGSGAKVVLLLSGDFTVECGAYEDSVDAIVHFGNAGYRSAYGLAEVLLGEVSPSGKLVETMAYDNDSSPASANFGDFTYTNGSSVKLTSANKYLVYQEGVYVDYKYYETRYSDCVEGIGNASSSAGSTSGGAWDFDDEVMYPFGYGLSYTSFTQEIVSDPVYDADEDTWTVSVEVTNVGDVAGKEVVQVYAQTPYTQYDESNGVEKPALQLMGFAKTGELGVTDDDNSEVVEVTVHQQWMASYDSAGAKGYIMDGGDYYLAVGNGSHEAMQNILAAKGYSSVGGDSDLACRISPDISATSLSPDTDVYRYVYNDETAVTNSFDDVDVNYYLDSSDEVTYLSRSDWESTYPEGLSLTASSDMLTSLNTKKKMDDGVIDTASRAETVEGLSYLTDSSEIDEDINALEMKGKDYDDEGWDEILDSMLIDDMSYMVSNGRYSIPAATSVNFPEMVGTDNPTGLWKQYAYSSISQTTGVGVEVSSSMTMRDGLIGEDVNVSDLYASMFASEPVLGASFSTELAERQGDMFAEDALYCGQRFIWGMGLNIHRTPYGGRASEYLSADPIHSTLMGTAWNLASLEKGCIMVAKHLVANEQEVNRTGVSTFMTEQTLREMYLRAFEGVSVYGNLKGVMTSYNRIGLISSAAEYDLMTVVLRDEWGFDGYTITDLYAITEGLYVGREMMIAGTNIMLGTGYDNTSGTYVQKSLNEENIMADDQLLTAVREACHRMMYVFVNSNGVNGYSTGARIVTVTPFYIPLMTALEVVFTVVAACSGVLLVTANVGKSKKKEA